MLLLETIRKISFTVGSDRLEASKLADFRTIRVFRERDFRSVCSSKILLLLNYFIFVSLFESARSTDHCPTLRSSRRVTFFFSEMPVNLHQYRGAIGVLTTASLWLAKNITTSQKPAIWKTISYLLQPSTL